MNRLHLSALVCLLVALPALGLNAQTSVPGNVQPQREQTGNAAQPSDANAGEVKPADTTRIIDVEAARRAKAREHSLSPVEYPFFPFILLGMGIQKAYTQGQRSGLVDKTEYFLTEHQSGFMGLLGGLGENSGISGGVEYYRNDFLRPEGKLQIPFRISDRRYRQVGLAWSLPLDSSRHVFLDTLADYQVRTQDEFYGEGNNTQLAFRTDYLQQVGEVFVGPRFRLKPRLQLSLRGGWRRTDITNGRKPADVEPGTRQLFPGLPGLDGWRQWIAGGDLTYDSRDVRTHPHVGGYYRIGAERHQSADAQDFGFWRYYGEGERFVPLFSPYRTLALRVIATNNRPLGGSQVPFFEEAILGGSRSLRAYRSFRFYDLTAAMATVEYRYSLNQIMDFFLFVEEGQVARTFGAMSWGGFRPSYGGGFSFFTENSGPVRITVAQGREGTALLLSLSTNF